MDLLISGEYLWQQDGVCGIDPLIAVTLFIPMKDHRCKGVTHTMGVLMVSQWWEKESRNHRRTHFSL